MMLYFYIYLQKHQEIKCVYIMFASNPTSHAHDYEYYFWVDPGWANWFPVLVLRRRVCSLAITSLWDTGLYLSKNVIQAKKFRALHAEWCNVM